MSDQTLRRKLIRLACSNPTVREALRPLLKEGRSDSPHQAMFNFYDALVGFQKVLKGLVRNRDILEWDPEYHHSIKQMANVIDRAVKEFTKVDDAFLETIDTLEDDGIL